MRPAVFIVSALAITQLAFANLDPQADQKIVSFLWSAAGGGDVGTTLMLTDVTAAYNTKITFTRNNEYLRSDGVRGTWECKGGELVLKGLDTEGFTIVLHPNTVMTNQMSGRFTEGRWKNNEILLTLPTSSDVKDATQDPIAGKWRWFNEAMVQIDADGTFSCNGQLAGTWKLTDEDNRRDTIRWGSGNIEDYATLTQDGKKLRMRNHDGFKHVAQRIEQL